MKKRKFSVALLLLGSLFLLVACGDKEKKADDETIRVGSVGSDAQIWKFIAKSDAAKKAGVKIEVKEITGGVQTNKAVTDDDVDVNAFQSIAYMDSFNEDSDIKLVPIATTYIEPMGIYSDKYKKIDDVKDGAVVAIADNPSNTTRALRLLESAGLITLKKDFNDGTGTPKDVTSNPKNLKFKLIDDTTGPRILPDVDLAVIGNTIALEGGLNVLKDAIYREKVEASTKNLINIIAVKKGNESDKKFAKLGELYHDPEVQAYIKKEFDGTKVEVDKPIKEVWQEKK